MGWGGGDDGVGGGWDRWRLDLFKASLAWAEMVAVVTERHSKSQKNEMFGRRRAKATEDCFEKALVARACNPGTQRSKGRSSRPAWLT